MKKAALVDRAFGITFKANAWTHRPAHRAMNPSARRGACTGSAMRSRHVTVFQAGVVQVVQLELARDFMKILENALEKDTVTMASVSARMDILEQTVESKLVPRTVPIEGLVFRVTAIVMLDSPDPLASSDHAR